MSNDKWIHEYTVFLGHISSYDLHLVDANIHHTWCR